MHLPTTKCWWEKAIGFGEILKMVQNGFKGRESIFVKAALEASYLVSVSIGVFLAGKAFCNSKQFQKFGLDSLIIVWFVLFFFVLSKENRMCWNEREKEKITNEGGGGRERILQKEWRSFIYWLLFGIVESLAFLGRLFAILGVPGFFCKVFGVEVGVTFARKILLSAAVISLGWCFLRLLGVCKRKRVQRKDKGVR